MRSALPLLFALASCHPRGAMRAPDAPPQPSDDGARSTERDDGRLRIRCDVLPGVDRSGRAPRYMLGLRFTNLTASPLRVYFPNAEIARFPMSALVLTAPGAEPVMPLSRPHGYVITEDDFPELAPGETRTFTQPLYLDALDGANVPRRRPGLAPGTAARLRWTYANRVERMPGGAHTLDGVTQPLFDGGPIPNLWTGSLTVEATWVLPSER